LRAPAIIEIELEAFAARRRGRQPTSPAAVFLVSW
jgi:hypothetical protein